MTKLILFLLLAFLYSYPAFSADVIYFTRHAEKEDNGKNPNLNDKGRKRASNIAILLSSADIAHIFSTNYNRTLQTAKPLSEYLGIKVELYNPKDLKVFAEELKNITGNILVVGHSNTTPELVGILSGKQVPAMSEGEYDTVFQLVLSGERTILNQLKSLPSQIPDSKQSEIKSKSK